MRIAVAMDEDSRIASHFGRCAGFLVFDIEHGEAGESGFRPNTVEHHRARHDGECSHTGAQHDHRSFVEALADCQTVICRGMGRRARADLAAHGIAPAVTSENVSAREAARLWAQGRLVLSAESEGCTH